MKLTEQLAFEGFGVRLREKVGDAIDLLLRHEAEALRLHDAGYYLAFSGGKDSCVIKALASMAGVRFTAHYSQTGIDPPELVRFIKHEHSDVQWNRAIRPFWAGIQVHGLPTRFGRWCCEDYKERHGKGRLMILGVRWQESRRRVKAWREYQEWHGNLSVCPILRWTDDDVWRFIRSHGIPYCSLYDEGWTRLGCIGCPMASQTKRQAEFVRWPRFAALWRKAAVSYWQSRQDKQGRHGPHWMRSFPSGDAYWHWWLGDEAGIEDECPGLFDA